MRQALTFGAYEPDKAPFQATVLKDMANAYPIANGYSPVGAFTAITSALPHAFTGGAAFVDSAENGTLLAGSSTALYRFTGGAWTALLTGISAPRRWQYTQFGDAVVAVNGGVTQQINLTAATAAPLTGAPTGASVATVRDFVVYGGANSNASLVQWSGFNDQTKNTPGEDQAGYQPMLDGGDVMGLAGGEYGLIIQRGAVRKMTYIGDTTIDSDVIIPFQFDVISPDTGAISSGSIAQTGRRVYFLSDRGFMYCDGTDVTPIGTERVDASFFALHDRTALDSMYSAIDPRRTTVAWLVPGLPGRIWVYNWTLDRWSIITIDAKAVMAGFTTNVTLESLNATYPNLDTMPYSLDDPRFAGGDPLLFIVNNADTVGTLAGANMPASFTTAFTELTAANRSRLRWIRPIGDATDGPTATVDCRQRLGDPPGQTSFTTLNDSGDMPVRTSGRYVSLVMQYAAGAVWSYVQGVEFVIEAGGSR